MEINDFYISLPSNTKTIGQKANTTSVFRVRLPREIRLSGEWEVALVEFLYSRSWDNVTNETDPDLAMENGVAFIKNGIPKKVYYSSIAAGHYDTVEALLSAVERCELTIIHTLDEQLQGVRPFVFRILILKILK